MINLFRIALILLIADLLLIGGFLVWQFQRDSVTIEISDLSPFVVGAGILIALAGLLHNITRSRSEDILEAVMELYEKAYEKLAPTDDLGQPNNTRRSWLSSARLIATAEKLSGDITEVSHKSIYRQTKEYWRAKFHELIFPSIEGLPSTFYADSPNHMTFWSGRERDPISEKSLAYLYRFIKWPEDIGDPLEGEENFTDEEIHQMETFGPRALGQLMREVRNLR
jgi:hypothetical protein